MLRVTLYTKTECPLCDTVKADLVALQDEIGFQLDEVDIQKDAGTFERFRYLIPVVDIDGEHLLYPPHDWLQLYNALRTAQLRR